MLAAIKKLFMEAVYPWTPLIEPKDPIQDALEKRERDYKKLTRDSYTLFIKTLWPDLIARAIRKEVLSHMHILHGRSGYPCYPWIDDPDLVEEFMDLLENLPHVAEFHGPGHLESDNTLVIYFFVEDKGWFARRQEMIRKMHAAERDFETLEEDEASDLDDEGYFGP